MSDLFEMVGVKPELAEQQVQKKENRWYDTIPWLSVIILILIVGGCLFCQSNHDKRSVLHGSEKLYNCSM